MEISKIAVNGSTYDIKDTNTVTSINGKTGAIGASDIASVLTEAGYKLTDTDNTGAENKPTYIASEVMSISVESVPGNMSSSCSITGSSNAGKAQTIIYTNSNSADYTVTVPTTYKTPNGAAIELTCKAGGYCEVSYLNIGGTIYARGL